MICLSKRSLFRERAGELVEIIGKEMGKIHGEGQWEAGLVADIFDWYAKNAEELLADRELNAEGAPINIVRHTPMGALLGILPWNFPYYQITRFAAPNLLLGNTILMKQAPICPESSAFFEQIMLDAGITEGAYQNLYLEVEDVETVIADSRVKGVSVTGSERAGITVATNVAKNLKKSVRELGGNDPAIVLNDVNVPLVAENLVRTRLFNAGQVCISPKRIIVVEDIYDEFVENAKRVIESIKVGPADDASSEMGPMSSEAARDQVVERIAQAVKDGATLHFGGVNKSGYDRELTDLGLYEFSNEKLIRGKKIEA